MEDKKSKSKKVITIVIVSVVIVLVVAGIGVTSFLNSIAQAGILNQEIDNINTTGNVDTEIKSKGKYGEVEKALKDYVLEYQNLTDEITNQYQNEELSKILSADNLKNDGPEFIESKKLISDTKTKGEEVKNKLAEIVSNEYKEKKATESGLTGKYKDIFINNIQLDQELNTINSRIDNINNYLAKIDDVFNFLIENKGNWEVKNSTVEFTQISLVTKYNSLITSVNIAAQTIK